MLEFYYDHLRRDIIDFIEKNKIDKKLIHTDCLEVGCGSGVTGSYIKNKYHVKNYVGVELNSNAYEVANQNLDKCYNGDIKYLLENELKGQKFDAVLFFDVLEHLYDPWDIINKATSILKKDGIIILSVPNASHYLFAGNLMLGKINYNPNGGLLDFTHIRWFTISSIKDLLESNNYKIVNDYLKTTKIKKWYLRPLNLILERFFKQNITIQYFVFAVKK